MAMVVAGEGGGGGGGAEETAAKAVVKRYEGLVTVRNKAVKGKGAWYWAHLEPLMVHNHENGMPKAVKLKCCLCHTMFSASNPSRTASEHLKRGTCPHFSSAISAGVSPPPPPHAAAGYPPPPASAAKLVHRKRSSSSSSTADGVAAQNNNNNSENCDGGATSYDVAPISVVDPSRFSSEMGFSGGALVVHPNTNTNPNPSFHSLASPVGSSGGGGGGRSGGGGGGGGGRMEVKKFEQSVKKLKGGPPNEVVTGGSGTLSKAQIESALEYLSDWVYESCGSVSFSSLEHPKFKSFLKQVGMVEVCKRDLVGSRLDSRFHEVKNECDSRIRDALFFQIASHGWNNRGKTSGGLEGSLVSVTVNLPNGASLFRRAVFTNGEVSDKFAEDVLWETIVDICGHSVHQCVGVVADKFKSTALKSMESQYGWMINLSCQCRALDSLIKDFYRELPLFRNVAQTCQKLANIVSNKTLRSCFHKYQLMDCGRVGGLFRVDGSLFQQESSNFEPVYGMIEDIMSSTGVLQSVLLDESYKAACMEDPVVRDFGEIIRDVGFLNDLEAVRSLVRLVKETSHEFESERPLVGQCLHLWEELRAKVKEWCAKFHIVDIIIEKVIERRFRKNYHPAWAAAYILDPFYMVRDTSGKYLPPFKYLTSEQQKDVHDLVTKLVSREEVPVAMSELMRWRSDGLDPVYAQAVQLKQRDTRTGKMRIANPQGSRLVWETYLPEFQLLGKVALRLIFLQATARGFNCNSSLLNWVQSRGRSRSAIDKAQKMIFISAHSKLERRDFISEEDKDAELFGSANGEDDVLNEVYVDQ